MKASGKNIPSILNVLASQNLILSGSTVFLLVFGLFVAVRFWHPAYYCLDGDEIFSLNIARDSWSNLLPAVGSDLVHPPLSYFLLKAWVSIGGDGILWLRLLPTLLSVASVIPFLLLCRALKLNSCVIGLALYLIAVNGYLIYWAHDIRMYSLVLFLSLFSYWLFVRFYEESENRPTTAFGLAVVNLLLIYTHYFGFLVISTEFAFLLFAARRKLPIYALGVIFWTAAFIPWAYVVVHAAAARNGFQQNLGWIPRPGIPEIAWFYATLNGAIRIEHSTLIGLLLFGIPALAILLRDRPASFLRPTNGERGKWLLFAAASLPVVAAFCASRALPQSIWGDRHLIIVSVPYFILAATGIFEINSNLIRRFAIIAVTLWAGIAGFLNFNENLRPAWDKATLEMVSSEPASSPEVVVYTAEEVVGPILDFYLNENNAPNFSIRTVANADMMEGGHFWVVLRTQAGRQDKTMQENLESRGYRIGNEFISDTPLERVTVFPVWRELPAAE